MAKRYGRGRPWVTREVDLTLSPGGMTVVSGANGSGGSTRVRFAKLGVAATVGLAMTGISLAAAFATNTSSIKPADLAAGGAAHLLALVGGVALGSVCARPLVTRTGWAALAIVAVTLIDIVVPGAPPVHVVLAALEGQHAGVPWSSLAWGVVGTGLFAGALVGASLYLGRFRS